MPIAPSNFKKATLTPLPNGYPITVHFNPTSLTYTVESSAPQTASHPKTAQFAAKVSGKLSMDLEFDTTDIGIDVRLITNQIAAFISPPKAAGGSSSGTPAPAPSVLKFSWGTYTFDGILQSFTETIDFFSADGVALRAKISISLSEQDQVYPFLSSDQPATLPSSASVVPTTPDDSVAGAAAQGGDATAARQLARDTGLESLRFGAGASLQVSGGVSLNAAAGFSAGASASFSTGVSASIGVSGGAGISLQSSGGGPIFGASASAGVPATAGAFAGLQVGVATVSTTTRLNTSLMLPSTSGSDLSTAAGASFSLGGSANSGAGPGLSANVGATSSFNASLTFDGD
jgi:hypothetical protein